MFHKTTACTMCKWWRMLRCYAYICTDDTGLQELAVFPLWDLSSPADNTQRHIMYNNRTLLTSFTLGISQGNNNYRVNMKGRKLVSKQLTPKHSLFEVPLNNVFLSNICCLSPSDQTLHQLVSLTITDPTHWQILQISSREWLLIYNYRSLNNSIHLQFCDHLTTNSTSANVGATHKWHTYPYPHSPIHLGRPGSLQPSLSPLWYCQIPNQQCHSWNLRYPTALQTEENMVLYTHGSLMCITHPQTNPLANVNVARKKLVERMTRGISKRKEQSE